jgi:hypothetical protein
MVVAGIVDAGFSEGRARLRASGVERFCSRQWQGSPETSRCMKTSIRLLAIITLTLVGFALSPKAQAVSPPPDGGYPGGNTAEGENALLSLTTGGFNTAVGFFSLRSNTLGQFNTAFGAGTLLFNVGDPATLAGIENTAVGAGALFSNTLGANNTAAGAFALLSNDMGFDNTAMGDRALLSNTSGDGNTALGTDALRFNTIGSGNTAVGDGALDFNTEAFNNTAIGSTALAGNTVGDENTALGSSALLFNTEGSFNTAIGFEALYSNTTGSSNTAAGLDALTENTTGTGNTAIGNDALLANTTGSNNTALGTEAGTNVNTASNVICVGAPGADVSSTCFIGNIRGVATQNADAVPVLIDSAGQLGTMSSSRRFKKEIKPMDTASEAILALKPVTFHYKSDKKDTPQFGLIAEEVGNVNPDLVVRDKNGDIYTVRYDAVNAMLLNEFLKEHRKVEELKSAMAQQRNDFEGAIAQQLKTTEAVVARLNEQEAQIQKVSAEVGASKPASQMLVGNQ